MGKTTVFLCGLVAAFTLAGSGCRKKAKVPKPKPVQTAPQALRGGKTHQFLKIYKEKDGRWGYYLVCKGSSIDSRTCCYSLEGVLEELKSLYRKSWKECASIRQVFFLDYTRSKQPDQVEREKAVIRKYLGKGAEVEYKKRGKLRKWLFEEILWNSDNFKLDYFLLYKKRCHHARKKNSQWRIAGKDNP